MSAPPKKKLCWNCEGNVSYQEENCPFCGVYLSPSDEEISDEGIDDLFSPPYQTYDEEGDGEIPPSPYQMEEEEPKVEMETPVTTEAVAQPDEMKRVVVPLTLLLAGTVFFLFGLALLLFSRGGFFILRWNGAYWHLYLGLGLAALFFGWKSLQQLGESEE